MEIDEKSLLNVVESAFNKVSNNFENIDEISKNFDSMFSEIDNFSSMGHVYLRLSSSYCGYEYSYEDSACNYSKIPEINKSINEMFNRIDDEFYDELSSKYSKEFDSLGIKSRKEFNDRLRVDDLQGTSLYDIKNKLELKYSDGLCLGSTGINVYIVSSFEHDIDGGVLHLTANFNNTYVTYFDDDIGGYDLDNVSSRSIKYDKNMDKYEFFCKIINAIYSIINSIV